MAKRTLKNLAATYEVENFFDYICESYINGNKEQAIKLFYEMCRKDRADFMNELNYCTFTRSFGDGPWQMDLLHEIIYSLFNKGMI
ncbi:hypothetical protein [Prevotella sp. E2-28]|uniref:hypothetical protein n=1 Tax=Prevotella sp. E2-28 TaxID=2913620 RepID=UPI001EDB1769|nr:hypothetical protein [Prevotella sp. E2-28]UKK52701.1 hypothetical protein L6465_08795 [Prevotella sp. E2-28]